MERVSADEREPAQVSDGVYLADLATGERAGMTYWRIDPGERLPPHRHDNEQIGYVISGRLVALVEGEEHVLEPGDSYAFPSGELHGAENRGDEPAVGVGILSPPRDEPDWSDGTADAESESQSQSESESESGTAASPAESD
jgi:quercetin dioxygenase-like cupin family protein